MAFKFVVLSCLLAYAAAYPAATSFSSINQGQLKLAPVAHYAAPIAIHQAPLLKKVIVEEAPAHYEFAYAVNDLHTGDIKEQKESRDGHTVKGMYSLVEPDGTKRIVEYTADEHNGFQAVVHREPGQHPVQVKAVPVLKTVATPVIKYAAPVIKYAAPVVKYTAPVVKYTAPVVKTYAAPLLKAAPVAHFSAAPAVSFATLSTPHFQIHH